MIAEVTILRSWWQVWPCFAAGFCGPLLGLLLAQWLPFHFAIGIAFFVMWFLAGFVFAGKAVPKLKIPRWLAAGLTGAVAGLGVTFLSFFFPWN